MNENRKLEFVEEYCGTEQYKTRTINRFKLAANVEERFHTDVAAMNAEQLTAVFNAVGGVKSLSIEQLYIVLKEYVKWCRRRGYPVTGAIDQINFAFLDKFRNAMIGSPRHLQRTLDFVFDRCEENEARYTYRAFFWMAFSGMSDLEAVRVRESDVNLNAMSVMLIPSTWTTYRLCAESVPDIYKSCTLRQFAIKRRGISFYDRAPGDYIMRGTGEAKPMEDMLVSTIRPVISRAFRGTAASLQKEGRPVPEGVSLNITYKRVLTSGIFYRMYEDERVGITPNFLKYVEVDIKGRENQSVARIDTLRGYEEDYARWKAAFTI